MSDIYEKLAERIEAAGVPAEMAEALVNLNKEVVGFWGAKGWSNSEEMARFIVSRLSYYGGLFHALAFKAAKETE